MNTEDQSAGIHEEIHFWEHCLTNLRHIRQQLQRSELQNVIRALNLCKSAYIQQFLQVEKEVQVKDEFTKSNFLAQYPLEIHRLRGGMLEIPEDSLRIFTAAESRSHRPTETRDPRDFLSHSNHLASFELLSHSRTNSTDYQQS